MTISILKWIHFNDSIVSSSLFKKLILHLILILVTHYERPEKDIKDM